MKTWLKGALIGVLLFLAYRLYLAVIGKCFFIIRMLIGGIAPCISYWNVIITLIAAAAFFILGALIGWLIGRNKR